MAAAILLLAVLAVTVAATMAGMPAEAAVTPPLERAMVALLVGTTVMGAMEAMPMAVVGAMEATEVMASVEILVMDQAMGAAPVGMASPSTQSAANLLQVATYFDVGI